jgi:uncharacterized protein YdeI (YjbR/CyaY-like superfamily)
MQVNPKVNFYFDKANPTDGNAGKWQEEIRMLRSIILECELDEELKWGVPTYTFSGLKAKKSNIVLIHIFKEYCAVLFFKGALINDIHGILIQQTKNVQVPRQIRFTSVKEVVSLAPILKAYIYEAINIEKAGLKVALKKPSEFEMAEEFEQQLKKMPALQTAFKSLTPGRQRAYLLHFSAPKQAKTREARVEKCIEPILAGKGLNDI